MLELLKMRIQVLKDICDVKHVDGEDNEDNYVKKLEAAKAEIDEILELIPDIEAKVFLTELTYISFS